MQCIVYELERDIAIGYIVPEDLVIVGLTGPDRWFYFRDDGYPKPVVLGYDHNWPDKRFRETFVANVANDYFNLYNYFHCLKYLDMISTQWSGRLLQQYMHQPFDDYKKSLNIRLRPEFEKLISKVDDITSIIDREYSFGRTINWNTDTHPGMHPRVEFHKKFASHIADVLKRNQ
jgi:hypothetical protein